jgi:hypothetical protein
VTRPRLIAILIGALAGLLASAASACITFRPHVSLGFVEWLMVPVFLCGAAYFAHGLRCWAGQYRAAKEACEHSAPNLPIQEIEK